MYKTSRLCFLSVGLFILILASCKPVQQAFDVSTSTSNADAEPVVGNPYIDYNPFRQKEFLLKHTRLEVAFDWEKNQLLGNARLKLEAFAESRQQLVLDAKAFYLQEVALLANNEAKPLQYTYDGYQIAIQLPAAIQPGAAFEVAIQYKAMPDSVQYLDRIPTPQSNKGLYFVKPQPYSLKDWQVWTQSQPEAASCWFPTIDAPNQRTTQELFITVGDSLQTLSNGELIYSKYNADNTRTDYWKMDDAHAPYLFMLAAGKFSITEDKVGDLPLSYFVEPSYASSAKRIFRHTPEMITFFSSIYQTPFPWNKYAQIIVRDFVSGAMENTTASVFMEELLSDSAQLVDTHWDGIIAHELAHQWFGNLVTARDWGQVALNESFAEYAEYLWFEHKYGKSEADYEFLSVLEGFVDAYIEQSKPIIRQRYAHPDDMFDAFVYQKGAAVLHMLRHYLGDRLFFNALGLYLRQHAMANAEIHQLRYAFEQVSGQDLRWFFHQWFEYDKLPLLSVTPYYKEGKLTLLLQQQISASSPFVFSLPLRFSVILPDSSKLQLQHQMRSATDSIIVSISEAPIMIELDRDLSALVVVDFQRSVEEYRIQLQLGEHFLTRYEAALVIAEVIHFPSSSCILNSC
jgi:aminopeptidase N